MVKLPAGITTISGQAGQSRNTEPGVRPEEGAVPCPQASEQASRTRSEKAFIIPTEPSEVWSINLGHRA